MSLTVLRGGGLRQSRMPTAIFIYALRSPCTGSDLQHVNRQSARSPMLHLFLPDMTSPVKTNCTFREFSLAASWLLRSSRSRPQPGSHHAWRCLRNVRGCHNRFSGRSEARRRGSGCVCVNIIQLHKSGSINNWVVRSVALDTGTEWTPRNCMAFILQNRTRICKRLGSPGIDSKRIDFASLWIGPPGLHRLTESISGFLERLQIRAYK
jgi:hypothetical protein